MSPGRYRARLKEVDFEYKNYCIDQRDSENDSNSAKKAFNIQEIFKQMSVKSLEFEIGCGNGHFILSKALENPGVCYIANEIKETVTKKAIIKIHKQNLKNVFFLRGDIQYFINFFNDDSLDCVYINFPDPWPKNRHLKRRLINQIFLNIIYQKLKKFGIIYFVSDNKNYIDYSIAQFKEFLKFKPCIPNFGTIGELPGYPTSLYESLFRKQNIPIYYTYYRK